MTKLLPNEAIPSVTFKTGKTEYVALGTFGSILGILFVCGMVTHHSLQAWPALVIIFVLMGLIFFGFARFELKVTPLEISYATLFAKKRTILIEELAAVEIITGGQPTYCMLFRPKENSGTAAISINIKPLRRDDLRMLALFLPKAASHVRYDERFLMMAEGKMPSVIFKQQWRGGSGFLCRFP